MKTFDIRLISGETRFMISLAVANLSELSLEIVWFIDGTILFGRD